MRQRPNQFLEVAVVTSYAGGSDRHVTWKVHGPDASGSYGGFNGLGGLEASVDGDPSSGEWTAYVDDFYGHIVGLHEGEPGSATFRWHATRSSSYGPMAGSPVRALCESISPEGDVLLGDATAWLGKRQDITGFYYLGARYYESSGGRFISPDPLGHAASMSLYDYAGGDPVNFCDPDGRKPGQPDPSGATMSIFQEMQNSRARTSSTMFGLIDSLGISDPAEIQHIALRVNEATARQGDGLMVIDSAVRQAHAKWVNQQLSAQFLQEDPRFLNPANLMSPNLVPRAHGGQEVTWQQGASMGADFIPGVGTVKSIMELVSGKDYITGEDANRWVSGAGAVAGWLPGGKGAVKGIASAFRHSDDVARVAAHADEVVDAANRGGRGLIGVVRVGGTVDDSLGETYVKLAQSPQFARNVARYNRLAGLLGQKKIGSVNEVVMALRTDTTFAKIGNIRAGVFTPGQHSASTQFWLQGNPLSAYGGRAGRHELLHIGAALRGQGDTFLHEIAVQAASTPEGLVIGAGIIVGGVSGGYYISN